MQNLDLLYAPTSSTVVGQPMPSIAEKASTIATWRKSRYYYRLYTEIHERQQAEKSLRQTNNLLNALSKAQFHFLSNVELPVVLKDLLDEILAITESEYGLIGEAQVGEDTIDGFKTVAFSHTCQPDGAEVDALITLVDEVIESGHQVLADLTGNALGSHSPDDRCTESSALLGLPLYMGKSVVGVVGFANRPGGYDQDAIDFLQPVLSACAQLIVADRNERRRRKAEEELSEERASLARRVGERTADLRTANAELAHALRVRDEFLATMNHELRTPLNAILLLSELQQRQILGPLNEKQLKNLSNIEESGRHLLELINGILDIVKINAGKFEMDIGDISVESICKASLRMIHAMAEKKNIKVMLSIEPQVTSIAADDRRLKQMLVNLLSNAIKFSPAGSSIGLEVTGDIENDIVQFTVWDHGIGIAQEDIQRLFKPFAQLDSGLAREYGGSGLGLVLVSRMAELHGGGVSVESEPGKGSRFKFSLPWHGEVGMPGAIVNMTLGQRSCDSPGGSSFASPIRSKHIRRATESGDVPE